MVYTEIEDPKLTCDDIVSRIFDLLLLLGGQLRIANDAFHACFVVGNVFIGAPAREIFRGIAGLMIDKVRTAEEEVLVGEVRTSDTQSVHAASQWVISTLPAVNWRFRSSPSGRIEA